MKKQKMTADNVEQLMEIVRAIQRGEDPDEALQRKKAESAPQADSPKSNLEKDHFGEEEAASLEKQPLSGKREKKNSSPKNAKRNGDTSRENSGNGAGLDPYDDEDEFEKILNEDAGSSLDFAETAELVKGGLQKVTGFFAGLKQNSKKKTKTEKKAVTRQDEQSALKKQKGQNEQEESEKKQNEADETARISLRLQESMSEIFPKAQEEEVQREYEQDQSKEQSRKKELNQTEEQNEAYEEYDSKEKLDLNETSGSDEISDREEELGERSAQRKILDRILDLNSADGEKETKVSEDSAAIERLNLAEGLEDAVDTGVEKALEAAGESGKVQNLEPEDVSPKGNDSGAADFLELSDDSNAADDLKKSGNRKITGVFANLKIRLGDFTAKLRQRSITSRELVMLAVCAVLVFLILVLVVNGIQGSLEEKRKSEHVTADKGLRVTVEDEPQQWSSSYPVKLRFRTQGKPVTKVTINDTVLQPDAQGYVIYETTDYLLEAIAETEDAVYKANIEIAKLDSQAPVVNASQAQNQITLIGADARSSVRRIMYAIVRPEDPLDLPRYQEYTGTIPYEQDVIYYFYAQDAAGNRSTPMVTTMETAEAIVLESTEIIMYPNETVTLSPSAVPEGALLNNLRIESMNTEILAVGNYGEVTALKEGTAAVKISADGMDDVLCTFDVSRERTVTISAIGDCTLGTDAYFNTTTNFTAYDTLNGHSYFFQNVSTILENDDATFANFEGTLTTSTTRESKQYAFKGDPSYTEILQDGSIEVVNLANNHSSDYGAQSLEDTKYYLTEADIDYCVDDIYSIRELNGIKTAFIGIYVLRDGMACESVLRQAIAAAQEDGAQLIITAFHWGTEKATEPDATQQELAHIAVDCGADLVVGHHPHVLQGIEKYNGKYIVYSLANFCFGGNNTPSDTDTMIFRQTFTLVDGAVQSDDQIEIIPCSVTSASGYNNYQPTPATGTEAERIMGRINEYSAAFGQSFTASDGL